MRILDADYADYTDLKHKDLTEKIIGAAYKV